MNNCNLTTCRYNENGKCTNEEKKEGFVKVGEKLYCIIYLNDIAKETDKKVADALMRLTPSELLMHMSDGIGHTETLKKFGIEIDLSKFQDENK